jgi:hypothetical protein
MKSLLPVIGFDRYVELDWCRESFEVALGKKTAEQLSELVGHALKGKESQRKALDILKRFSTKPFPELNNFVSRGLKIYESGDYTNTLPIAWGCAIASYPFFGFTAQTTGRLFSLHGDCSIKEIQRRMAENYGDRNGIERAVARVLQTQSKWGVFERDESKKRIWAKPQINILDEHLTTWLVESAIRFSGKPLPLVTIHTLPLLFPFKFKASLAYVISNSPNLELRSEGSDKQIVALRHT